MTPSAAGDLLENMAAEREYIDALDAGGAEVLLLSGGGNDLVAGGELAQHLRPFDPRLQPAQYLRRSFGGGARRRDRLHHERSSATPARLPACRVVCHGYDYAVPNGGDWLGRPMAAHGITDPQLQKAIAREMVDRLNTRLINLANDPAHRLRRLRGTVGDGRWFDELHPTDEGYGLVTRKIVAKFAELTAGSRDAPMPGHFRRRQPAGAPPRQVPDPAGGRRHRRLPLHVGLNASTRQVRGLGRR